MLLSTFSLLSLLFFFLVAVFMGCGSSWARDQTCTTAATLATAATMLALRHKGMHSAYFFLRY